MKLSSRLEISEAQSVFIFREAFACVKPLALLWSVGKDSNTLLWLARKAFLGRVPIPAIHLDTGMELPEVYAFRDRIAREWDLDLRIERCPPEEEIDPTLPPASRAAARKTAGLHNFVRRSDCRGLFAGIRRDEQITRAKERIFSRRSFDGTWNFRDQPPELWDHFNTDCPRGNHLRIHPLLHWSELDIWLYTKREGIPVVPLYFARDGQRYRSLGERNITVPIASTASTIDEIIAELSAIREPERAGRVMDHETEDAFERLRNAGYL